MDRSPWIRLEDATDPERAGAKAATLARLMGGGLPVLPGWVLPVGAEATVDALLAEDVSQWILRSSSPLEDRQGSSAAGFFVSASASAAPDELARALRRVLDSARDPRLVAVLGQEAPIAVLAQPHLEFGTWCAVELRDGGRFYEGWIDSGRESFRGASHPRLDALVVSAAQAAGIDPALLEIGIAGEQPWILQVRPAPMRAPSRRAGPVGARPKILHAGLGPRVHPGDERREWRADLEHCPTPMSVLLATCFGRWIAADAANSPSRIVDGRWHDAVTGDPGSGDVREDFERWQSDLAGRIEPGVRDLQLLHDRLDGSLATWRAFLDAWLGLQRAYFTMPARAPRTWARRELAQSSARAGLASTPSGERLRRWSMLRDQVLRVIAAPTPESIARHMAEHPDQMLSIVLRQTLHFDRRIAPLPYDGFTPGLDEDPWPFLRALCSEIRAPAAAPQDADLASRILAFAETDNDQLLEIYAIWRSAIRRIARSRGLASAHDLHFVDVGALEAWLAEGGEPPDASSGRALHAAWSAIRVGGGTLEGRPAAGGQARGPVRRGRSLLEIEEPGVAVVDTLGPADSIAVPRFDAIVCATGDVLGHASVICREFGIPCVVGIPGVRERLARATEILVDGDRGVVLDLSEDTAGN